MKRNQRKNRNIRKRRNPNGQEYGRLEDRKMLATVASLDSGVLTITGDNNADDVLFSPNLVNDTYEVIADFGGSNTLIGEYPNDGSITEVVFIGNAGDDIIRNSTSFPMRAFGNAGNDTFFGGSGVETVFGGNGDDVLFGNDGNDLLRGNDGSDAIYGGAGDDTLYGGNQNDSIFGGVGDDFINGERGDDVVFAGDGNDQILGFVGDDSVYGEEGDDVMYGQAGNDTLRGGEGVDRVRGNLGDDDLRGDEGNDVLLGDTGNDEMDGGAGNDLMIAFDGDDIMFGGDGHDRMYGQNGNDEMNGGAGNDAVRGGEDDDILRGDEGNDNLRGENGSDRMYGGVGTDRLFGGEGNDSLAGGVNADVDTLFGQGGGDRFLAELEEAISDQATEDAVINFVNDTSDWNDAEVELADEVLHVIHQRTGNTLLLKDSLLSDNLTFTKVATLPGTAFGTNSLDTVGNTRTIQFKEFNEDGLFDKSDFQTSVYTQIGRNWNSAEELEANDVGATFDAFMELSGWTATDLGSGFTSSNDGNWFYSNSASFTFSSDDADPRDNPYEDFAVHFEYYFDRYSSGNDPFGPLQSKYDFFDTWFDALAGA